MGFLTRHSLQTQGFPCSCLWCCAREGCKGGTKLVIRFIVDSSLVDRWFVLTSVCLGFRPRLSEETLVANLLCSLNKV